MEHETNLPEKKINKTYTFNHKGHNLSILMDSINFDILTAEIKKFKSVINKLEADKTIDKITLSSGGNKTFTRKHPPLSDGQMNELKPVITKDGVELELNKGNNDKGNWACYKREDSSNFKDVIWVNPNNFNEYKQEFTTNDKEPEIVNGAIVEKETEEQFKDIDDLS